MSAGEEAEEPARESTDKAAARGHDVDEALVDPRPDVKPEREAQRE